MSKPFAGRNLISLDTFTNSEIFHIFEVADKMEKVILTGSDLCKGKILSVLFFEPSTRTQFSFSSGMQRMGGGVIGFSDTSSTSVSKGETLQDTARIFQSYSDVIVMRHPEQGSMKVVADHIKVPLINGGEGKSEHPTQTLYDLFTIRKELGQLDVKIGFYGDLKYGRTNHSLIAAASRFGAKAYCIAPKDLQMPEEYVSKARSNGGTVDFAEKIEDVLGDIDVLYISRLQKERLPEWLNYDELKESYHCSLAMVQKMKERSLLMHPLPRVGEIADEVDLDHRAAYFRQAANGVPVRMAVLALALGVVD